MSLYNTCASVCMLQSPDVNPIQCPTDAFCPEGSTAPGYCMETFFRKVGETCELAPVTIALLVIGGGGMNIHITLNFSFINHNVKKCQFHKIKSMC